MTTNSELSTTEPKNKNKNELGKQLEQEQNHRNGDHREGYQRGSGCLLYTSDAADEQYIV